ncbi:MAG TPA: glycerol-3-phosphate 1-O-acyltransferase PlsY [Flavobacteriales bacterium]|jgi:glycerol-3-phosphate acyltransferase PlsY|nr:glycerol-3-phosphate 1-O-acyltransferase PlsY [Flavobacteriales bacterium]HIO67665.1 glycerol-3-phosphate 1-O-acyltransferase [Flavobacteriales bacterium]
MISLINILALVLAYLLGSIASAVWIGQIFYGTDVREYGSGNSGSTNAFRVLGKKAGIAVLLIDSAKGWLSVNLVTLLHTLEITHLLPGTGPFIDFQLALGIAALLGHIFPVYVGFRGGKGIATLLGIILAVHTGAALASMGVFIVVLLITRYVSLSSMVAATAFPVVVILVFETTISSLVIFSLVIAILVLITHQKNIERLLRKEESKANLFGKSEP